METKFCKYCQCEHPLTDEWWQRSKGILGQCRVKRKQYDAGRKEQKREYDRLYRKRHPGKYRERSRDFKRKNAKELAKKNKEYRDQHNEEINRKSRERYAKFHKKERITLTPEQKLERRRAYKQQNKDKIAQQQREYRKKHRESVNSAQKKYHNARYSSDTCFRLSKILRKRLNSAIKNGQKSGSAVKDLGCTIPELKQYLESKFQEGMTWENWGVHGWHIDHIIPLSSFDLADRDQLLTAFHYTNLQPLWAQANWSKGDRIL